MRKFRSLAVPLLFFTSFCLIWGCSSSDSDDTVELVSSRSYSGHESDADANHFVNVYPDTVGTRLDDCQTCHRAGVEGTDTERIFNSCDYCHLLEFPDDRLVTGVPAGFEDTLNPYGMDYYLAGRNRDALFAIENEDSDGDGFANVAEIDDLRYPGDATSKPDQPLALTVTLNRPEIDAMPWNEQFMLMNTTKQQYDDYVTYGGVTILDLLTEAGIDLTGAEGITVYAPDGFGKDFSMAEINRIYPKGTFYMTPEFDNPEKELVDYPPSVPEYVADEEEIPDSLRLMLALERNGEPLIPAYYDGETGRLEEEGPYRLIMPQKDPSRPDRGSRSEEFNDGWDFDEDIDHNAGSCVRGACVIRINPMPAGYEEFDWKNGWSLIEEEKVIIYGHGVAGN